MDWLRWYDGTVGDAKWRIVAGLARARVADVIAIWAAILERAGKSEPRGTITGWRDDVYAVLLDIKPDKVSAIRQAMQGLTLDGDRVMNWGKRQPMTVTERVRKHRQVKRATRPRRTVANAALTQSSVSGVTPAERDETNGNGVKRREEKRGEEKRLTSPELNLRSTEEDLSLNVDRSSSPAPAREADEPQTVDGQAGDLDSSIDQIIRLANRGMIDNPVLGESANPIPVGHGSREIVRGWLQSGIPQQVAGSVVYQRASEYRPSDRRRQPTTMRYFDDAVREAGDLAAAKNGAAPHPRESDRPGVAVQPNGPSLQEHWEKLDAVRVENESQWRARRQAAYDELTEASRKKYRKRAEAGQAFTPANATPELKEMILMESIFVLMGAEQNDPMPRA